MTHPREVDYIIVGQGLAGSALALQLLRRGRRLLVIDEAEKNRSSLQAAGLFNPITGRQMVKTWMADTLFPYLQKFYQEAEQISERRFFFPMPIYRPFASTEEQNEWMGKSADFSWSDYVEQVVTRSGRIEGVRDPFGGLLLKNAGYINTRVYIEAVRNLVRNTGVVMDTLFEDHLVEEEADFVRYGEFRARRIVLCQGERNHESRWFKKIPIRPLKGETLTLKSSLEGNRIINRGVYVVPGERSGEFRVGATYLPNDRSAGVSPVGRRDLEGKVSALLSLPFTVEDADWGIRPTTPDRRPILGSLHGSGGRVVIFNGMGTKGVSLAPYFSEVLVSWLENGLPIDQNVDVNRYN